MSGTIVPSLWFNRNAKEAVDYYVSVFANSRILNTAYYPASSEEGLADFQTEFAGTELAIDFELNGQRFGAINADATFTFSAATSFVVACKDQAEIDHFWERLSAVPEAEQCGWCKDRFGLSWQIVPENMGELMQRPDAYAHMMAMKKLVIADF